MREYEMILVLKPDCSDDEQERVFGKIQRAFDENGGHFLNKESWGKKKLAYEMQKNAKGLMFQVNYLGAPAANNAITQSLRIDDAVLRFQPIKLGEVLDVEARLAQAQSETRPPSSNIEDGAN